MTEDLPTRVRRVLAAYTFEFEESSNKRVLIVNAHGGRLCWNLHATDEKILGDTSRFWGPPPAPTPQQSTGPLQVGDWCLPKDDHGFGPRRTDGKPMRVVFASYEPGWERIQCVGFWDDAEPDHRTHWSAEVLVRCAPPQPSPAGHAGKESVTAEPCAPNPNPVSQPAALPEPLQCERCKLPEHAGRVLRRIPPPFSAINNGPLLCGDCRGNGPSEPKQFDGYGLDRPMREPRFPEPTMSSMVGRVGGRMARRFK